jgi:hypothetical protein
MAASDYVDNIASDEVCPLLDQLFNEEEVRAT